VMAQTYCWTKAALAEAVRRITGQAAGNTDPRHIVTIVLLGDGNFGTSYKGPVPSHHHQLREALHRAPNVIVLNVGKAGTFKVRVHKVRSIACRPARHGKRGEETVSLSAGLASPWPFCCGNGM
jgi:hypothetical protein